ESVREELDRDFDPPGGPPSGSGGPGASPPNHPAPPGSGTSSEEPDTGSTSSKDNIPTKNRVEPGHLVTQGVNKLNINNLTGDQVTENQTFDSANLVTNLSVDNEGITNEVTRCQGYPGVLSGYIPDSTPKAPFCTANPTLGMLPLDIETYYPWPDQGDFPQPTGPDNSLKKLKKR